LTISRVVSKTGRQTTSGIGSTRAWQVLRIFTGCQHNSWTVLEALQKNLKQDNFFLCGKMFCFLLSTCMWCSGCSLPFLLTFKFGLMLILSWMRSCLGPDFT